MTGFTERVRARLQQDSGLTLVELLVAISLFAVLLSLVGGTFYSITRATSFAAARDENSRVASTAMNEMIKKVRGAADNARVGLSDSAAFISAGGKNLKFTTLVSTGRVSVPQQVTLSLSSTGVLTENVVIGTTTDGTYYTFGGTGTTQTIATSIEVAGSADVPFFQYLDISRNVLTPDPATGVLSAVQADRVAFVQISIRVSSTASTLKNGITLQNTAGLPNLLEPTGDPT